MYGGCPDPSGERDHNVIHTLSESDFLSAGDYGKLSTTRAQLELSKQ